jgi:hypothetical protein
MSYDQWKLMSPEDEADQRAHRARRWEERMARADAAYDAWRDEGFDVEPIYQPRDDDRFDD